MRKYAYLARLEELLAALPAQERQEALNYYEEYFDAAGSEEEEKTAVELGDPADVARKILEEEGIETAPEESTPVSAAENAANSSPAPQPEPAVTAPAGPEPPPVEDPETYPAKGTGATAGSGKPYAKRLWLIFWLLVALALVVQISVLLLGLGNHGGSSASMALEAAESSTASYQEEAVAMSEPVSEEQQAGNVIYSGTLDTSGKGTLFVNLSCGNVSFRTGEQAEIEVYGNDSTGTVSYGQTVDFGYTLFCDSEDPDTHMTITLPADAYDKLEVSIDTQGAIELGNLQIRQISAYTASGPVQSGQLCTEQLSVSTEEGNIWLEKVSDSGKYRVEQVELLAPAGYVAVTLPGMESQWNTQITNGEQYTKKTQASEPLEGITRKLEVEHGSSLKLEYEA